MKVLLKLAYVQGLSVLASNDISDDFTSRDAPAISRKVFKFIFQIHEESHSWKTIISTLVMKFCYGNFSSALIHTQNHFQSGLVQVLTIPHVNLGDMT